MIWKTVLVWLSMNALLLSTTVVSNDAYSSVVATAMWIFIVIVLLGSIGMFVSAFSVNETLKKTYSIFDIKKFDEVLEAWEKIPEQKTWRSILFSGVTLSSLIYLEWVVTAPAYLLSALAAFYGMRYAHKAMSDLRDKKAELSNEFDSDWEPQHVSEQREPNVY